MIVNPKLKITAFVEPFRHWVIDDFLTKDDADMLSDLFPDADNNWYEYRNIFEKKRALDKIEFMPSAHALTLLYLNSAPWVYVLENITGIKGLIGDPAFRGGGLHQIYPGGKLDVHADFNFHQHLKLDRRLNMLLYLNKDWRPEWKGQLELWPTDMSECRIKIEPIFNRCVIFETTDWAFHGHPENLDCPEGRTRKSMAWYYYTNGRPEHEKTPPHSTKFQKRPGDDESGEIERLRELRNKGRL